MPDDSFKYFIENNYNKSNVFNNFSEVQVGDPALCPFSFPPQISACSIFRVLTVGASIDLQNEVNYILKGANLQI